MKQRFLFTDGESKYYDGVKHKTLFKDGDEYSAYWTNGKKVTTCTTNAEDDETAEVELKLALIDYWFTLSVAVERPQSRLRPLFSRG